MKTEISEGLELIEDPFCEGDLNLHKVDAVYNGNKVGKSFLRLPPFPANFSLPSEFYNLFYLTRLEVEPEFRGKGIGKMLLGKTLDYADENHTPVFTRPLPFGEEPFVPRDELIDFYCRHGFRKYDSVFLVRGRRKV